MQEGKTKAGGGSEKMPRRSSRKRWNPVYKDSIRKVGTAIVVRTGMECERTNDDVLKNRKVSLRGDGDDDNNE